MLLFHSPVLPALTEFKSCQQHKSIVVILCGILQAITLKCPTALIWRNIKLNPGTQISEVKASAFKGSPLDLLPCAPSGLLSCFLSNDDASQDDDLQVMTAFSVKQAATSSPNRISSNLNRQIDLDPGTGNKFAKKLAMLA